MQNNSKGQAVEEILKPLLARNETMENTKVIFLLAIYINTDVAWHTLDGSEFQKSLEI